MKGLDLYVAGDWDSIGVLCPYGGDEDRATGMPIWHVEAYAWSREAGQAVGQAFHLEETLEAHVVDFRPPQLLCASARWANGAIRRFKHDAEPVFPLCADALEELRVDGLVDVGMAAPSLLKYIEKRGRYEPLKEYCRKLGEYLGNIRGEPLE